MIVFSAVGAAAMGIVTFEATHLYVEHFAMPRSAPSSKSDHWGWADETAEDIWGPSGGTDPKLGIKGRYLLRSAWICANWGGGISPVRFLSPGAGLPTAGRKPQPSIASSAHVDDGLNMAEKFLQATLAVAESKGIRLPDLAAVRAGAVPALHEAGADRPLDLTALAMEDRLASIRERIGSKDALQGALAGYTRIFDALASTDATNRAAALQKSDKDADPVKTGQPAIKPERLVKLATKIGDLHTVFGSREEAEAWLLKAVAIAGESAHETTKAIEGVRGGAGAVKNQVLAGVGGLSPESDTSAETKEAKMVVEGARNLNSASWWHWIGTSPSSPQDFDGTTVSPASESHREKEPGLTNATPPAPALTRSLISALLSLSSFYAQPSDRKSLEHALQFQAGALKLTRAEAERLAWAPVSPSDKTQSQAQRLPEAQLHALWLSHHDALASVHIAETIFALGSNRSIASTLSSLFVGSGDTDKHMKSIEWLGEADERAQKITSELSKKGKSSRGDLDDKWRVRREIEVPASRLLRDALRVRTVTEDMRSILQQKS